MLGIVLITCVQRLLGDMIDRALIEKHFLAFTPAFIAVPDDGAIGLVAADAVKNEPDDLNTLRDDFQFIIAQIPDAKAAAACA